MIYDNCSISEILARVVRNTRVQDSSYLVDADEWISEAVAKLQCTVHSVFSYRDSEVRFYASPMPCDLVNLAGIEYGGKRLRYTTTMRHPRFAKVSHPVNPSVVTSIPSATIIRNHKFATTTYKQLQDAEVSNDFYTTEPGSIITSFEQGIIRVHGKVVPQDPHGLPLIPNNDNVKTAIYWYVRMMMVGCGWNDPAFKFDYMDAQWEKYARRGINEMKFWNIEQAEEALNNQVKLVFPDNYYDTFFTHVGHADGSAATQPPVLPVNTTLIDNSSQILSDLIGTDKSLGTEIAETKASIDGSRLDRRLIIVKRDETAGGTKTIYLYDQGTGLTEFITS